MAFATLTPAGLCFRLMVRSDIGRIAEIERLSYPAPWVADELYCLLGRRNCLGMAVEAAPFPANRCGQPIAHAVYEVRRNKIDLLTLAVHPEYRRRGVGRAIVAKLAGKLSSHRRGWLTVEVRESNLAGLAFLKAQGFRAAALLRGRCGDTGEDAILMRYGESGEADQP